MPFVRICEIFFDELDFVRIFSFSQILTKIKKTVKMCEDL